MRSNKSEQIDAESMSPAVVSSAKISSGRKFKARNIGIHGAGKTGKTCYLACCLCGAKATENDGILPCGDVPSVLRMYGKRCRVAR